MENILSTEINKTKAEYQKNEANLSLLSNHYSIKEISTKREFFLKFHGFFYGILSALCLSLSSIFTKLAKFTTGSEQAFVRYIIQFLTIGFIIMYTKRTFLGPKESRKLLILRGSMSTLALLASHFALKLINPSDAVSLFNLNTIILSIMARFILKEKINLAHLICLVLSMLGVVFIVQPSVIFINITKDALKIDNFTNIKSNENEFVKINDKELFIGISIGKY